MQKYLYLYDEYKYYGFIIVVHHHCTPDDFKINGLIYMYENLFYVFCLKKKNGCMAKVSLLLFQDHLELIIPIYCVLRLT